MNSISMTGYEQEYKEMKMVLRGIAHEMGNALTVMGYSIKSFGKDANIKENENWNYINEDYDYICRLFKNLSAYNNSRELQVKEIQVDKLLISVIAVIHDEYLSNGVRINYQGIRDAVIIGDDIKLKQVFINIIKNAYEAVTVSRKKDKKELCDKDEGLINIKITERDDVYQISVKDNGCGIETKNMKKIFEPMYTENKEGGTGLGLPVCKNIIESHKGRINVESTLGYGTEFIIELEKLNK